MSLCSRLVVCKNALGVNNAILYQTRALAEFQRKLSVQSNPKVDVNLFSELGVSSKIRKSLAAEDITVPTLVQHEVLPITLSSTQNCIVQSPTGSGKTLTYLIPALQDPYPGLHSLIIVPSRELAIQIEHFARKLISKGKLSRSLLTLYSGGSDSVSLKEVIRTSPPPGIIVGTPKRLLELVKLEAGMFKFVRRIILDEVDKLLPSGQKKVRTFSKKRLFLHEHTKPAAAIMRWLVSVNHDRHNVQYIASSATINEELIDKLVEYGWNEDYRIISTSQMDSLSTPTTIRHGYIVDSSNSLQYNKLDLLATYLRKNQGKAMVVIHRNAPISTFVFELRQRKVNAVPLHEHTLNASTYSAFLQEFRSGEYMCTELCMFVLGPHDRG